MKKFLSFLKSLCEWFMYSLHFGISSPTSSQYHRLLYLSLWSNAAKCVPVSVSMCVRFHMQCLWAQLQSTVIISVVNLNVLSSLCSEGSAAHKHTTQREIQKAARGGQKFMPRPWLLTVQQWAPFYTTHDSCTQPANWREKLRYDIERKQEHLCFVKGGGVIYLGYI